MKNLKQTILLTMFVLLGITAQAQTYNAADVSALQVFLGQTSANTTKTNGEQLGLPASLPADDSWIETLTTNGKISWTDTEPKQLKTILIIGPSSLVEGLGGILDVSNLTALESLNCSGNRLTKVIVTGCSSLTNLNIYLNQIKFSDMPEVDNSVNLASPVQMINPGEIEFENNSIDLSGEMALKGEITEIVWQSGTTLIEGTDYTNTNGVFHFTNIDLAGKNVIGIMANPAFPGMQVLYWFTFTSPTYNATDVAALKAFLEQPSAETAKTNGQQLGLPAVLFTPEKIWVELLVSQNYISWTKNYPNTNLKSIDFSDKKLAGVLDMSNCNSLMVIYCDNNSLTKVQVSSSVKLLDAQNNQLKLSEMPPVENFSACEYGNQFWTKRYAKHEDPIDLSDEYIVNGKTTEFIWAVNSPVIGFKVLAENTDYTNNNGIFTFINPVLNCQNILCLMVNENFPTTYVYADYTLAPYSDPDFVVDTNGKLIEYNGTGGDIVIPYNVKTIGSGVFQNNTTINSVIMPSSVTSIGSGGNGGSFAGCTNLTSVTIPSSVNYIDSGSFLYCTSLQEINASWGNPQSVANGGYITYGSGIFSFVPTSCIVNYPAGCLQYYQIFPWWYFDNIGGYTTEIAETHVTAEPIIYTSNRNIIIENANNAVSVYDLTGRCVGITASCRDAMHCVSTTGTRTIPVPQSGAYIIQTGNMVKKIVVK